MAANVVVSSQVSLEGDLVHKPEREWGGGLVAEVSEGVEEGHVGAAHKGVADLVVEGEEGEAHDEPGHPVEDVEAGQQEVEVARKSSILRLYGDSDVHLRGRWRMWRFVLDLRGVSVGHRI